MPIVASAIERRPGSIDISARNGSRIRVAEFFKEEELEIENEATSGLITL